MKEEQDQPPRYSVIDAGGWEADEVNTQGTKTDPSCTM
jgi:hypothetical protein